MSFCRITGRSRGLPKPNYFPLLAPISPADAKRCCRITGKSYGLPTHHYIPVLLTARSSKTKCKITNVSGELGPHHYAPEINYGNRKHEMLPDYRYIFPVLDGATEAQKCLIEMLLGKQVTDDKRYVYTVQERRCSLVFSAQMEAAVRDGDVRDVMLAKDSDTVLIKTKQGRSVSMDFKDFTEDIEIYEGEGPNAEVLKQREIEELQEKKKKRKREAGLSSMKKIFENKEKLAEVEELEEEKLRYDRLSKKAKLDVKHEKHDMKTFSYNSFDEKHMRSKSSIVMSSGEWRDQMHPIIESWDWNSFEKESSNENCVSKVTKLPTPVLITPYFCEAEIYETDRNISDVSNPLDNVPCVNPLKPIKARPTETVISAIKDIPKERLAETLDVAEKLLNSEKVEMLATMEELPDFVKNIKKGKREKVAKVPGLTLDINKAKKFMPGQVINTPQGPLFVPGQTVETPVGPVFVAGLSVNTPAGPGLIPGHIVTNENTDEPFFLAGHVLQTSKGDEFVCGQTIKAKDDSLRFIEGQTVLSEEGFKFVPGKIISSGSEDVFVPGQAIITPDGVQFIPGQTITEVSGVTFTPGQNAKINNEWQFVPGQVVHQDDELHFVPGATIATPNGLKFVPGQTVAVNGETCFIPGVTKSSSNELKFVPGTTVDTIDGPKFIEGQIVHTDFGEKFMPGKTVIQADGHVEFSVAKSVEDITFSESTPMGLPIDIKTCTLSEESLYVFGHMVQTAKGIEFYPGARVPKQEGKVVPGRLVKNEANESRFVPGTMVEGIFVPGQIVYTENGEQFVPGQVVDTADGPKFVPGQVVNTKSGPKFVPGQTIHTIDGPRFVPGQIIETKAGPTFIPGQVISTEAEGSRFVPGQVVDTEEGPRFVPGRVVETDDHGVTFVPGQIVQTPEGLKFVAPDLTEGEEGLEFSVQSFVVTPEELKLLKVKTNPNDTTSTKGELTIDTNMLRQLSEAGMSIGRQVPTDVPAINVLLNQTRNAEVLKAFVTDFGLKDEVANQLMDVISSIIEMSAHLKSEIHDSQKSEGSSNESKKSRNSKKKMEAQEHAGYSGGNGKSAQQEHVKNSIAAAVLAALVTAEQFEEVNNNIGKEKYQLILKSIDTILGKSIDADLVSAMFNILQKEEDKEILCEEILENSSEPKVELIKIAVNRALHKHSLTEEDIIEKFGDFLSTENEVLGPAFKNISKNDTTLLHHVLGRISESISFIKTDHEATETLQKAIVSAVQEASTKDLEVIMKESSKEEIKQLIVQSVGLARILGMRDVATNLLSLVNDEENMTKIAEDPITLNILKRLTVMRKLAEKNPTMHSALRKLESDSIVARTDPNLRDLVRESAALMIVPEEPPLLTSDDVPLSLLQPENSLAMEDFLFQRKKHPGALLIMKKGLQAVVPREASRAVLTGQVAYTVLDESGIRHFEPLHVFSALNLSKPTAHRFSMYSCPVVDDKDDDLETFTGYCNISNNQRITKLGGWDRRYSGISLDREKVRTRISHYDNTPSYKRYNSARSSSSRSRSSCSSSPSKVEDVVVASADYIATADDEVSIKAGDIVEVLDTKSTLGSKTLDPSLDMETELLDTSAARHKLAVRPRKKHPKGKKKTNEKWLVRVIDDVQGGELRTRQGLVPATVLQEKQNLERDQTSIAARRQAVVRELIETEEEFGRDMQQVVTRYMKPMDKATTPKLVFDNRELLFGNFKQICEFHNTVLLEGVKYYAGEPKMLGRALLRMEREFDKHVAYCRDEPRARNLLANEPVVKDYFKALADKLGDDKGIAEHLKLPIQRINDYQLLLKELVKYSQRLNEDCTDLQKALELFLGIPNRATNNKFISSIEGYRGNIYKLGRLLTHDWFTVTDSEGKASERYLFLFKARILVSKVKRVEDNRSVFLLKDIIKLPEVEVNDLGDPLKFELHLKNPSCVLTLAAHKDVTKTAWLAEIRKYASDLLALAEHAADDLQVLSPEPAEPATLEPVENKKKRDTSEAELVEEGKEKRSRVEEIKVEEISTRAESLEQLKAKRKASLESQVASKVSKTEVVEVSSTSDAKEKVTAVSTAKSEVTSDLESKSSVTASSAVVEESQSVTSQSISEQTVKAASKSIKVESQTSVQSSEQTVKESVQSSTVEQKVKESVHNSSINSSNSHQQSQEVLEQSSSVQVTQALSSQSAETTQSSHASVQQVTEQTSQESIKSESTKVEKQNVQQSSTVEQKSEQNTSESLVKETVSAGAKVSEQVTENSQTVTAEENNEEMSRYSRSSRLSGEYTSSSTRKSSTGGRYESSSAYDSSGLSSYARRESGSRLESSKYEAGGALEGSASSRYESKYSSSSRVEGGSKYGIESSYESKTEGSKYGIEGSKYGIESSFESKTEGSKYGIEGSKYGIECDTNSKLDSIASKYGLESKESKTEGSKYEVEYDSASKIDSIASKYGRETRKSEVEIEATSKLDAIASKYGIDRTDSYESSKVEKRSSKYGLEISLDDGKLESASKVESRYQSVKDGDVSESKYSKTAISNGSVTEEYESSKYVGKSQAQDGKPIFTKTLEGQNIEPGENATFVCALEKSSDPVKVTWLKNNKPMNDRLMDRCSITGDDADQIFELKHCREDDAGVYTAVAENIKGKSHCTAQLVVQELTAEERRERNALKAPYFLVALKDTEIMQNTYLRFMIRAKGDPYPELTFYRDGKEITSKSESDRISIICTNVDKGCYELIIPNVTQEDAGKYSCRAMNIYGDASCEANVTVVAKRTLPVVPEIPTDDSEDPVAQQTNIKKEEKNVFFNIALGGEGLLAKGEKPSFSWKRDGQPFDPEERFKVLLGDDEDSLALVFQHVKPEDAGLYTCVAKTSTGNISCSAELTVQAKKHPDSVAPAAAELGQAANAHHSNELNKGAINELHREPEKPKLVIEHREAIVSAGASAMLELQCKGYPKPSIVFKHDGKVIEADTKHNGGSENLDEELLQLEGDSPLVSAKLSDQLEEVSTITSTNVNAHLLDRDSQLQSAKLEGTQFNSDTSFKSNEAKVKSDLQLTLAKSEQTQLMSDSYLASETLNEIQLKNASQFASAESRQTQLKSDSHIASAMLNESQLTSDLQLSSAELNETRVKSNSQLASAKSVETQFKCDETQLKSDSKLVSFMSEQTQLQDDSQLASSKLNETQIKNDSKLRTAKSSGVRFEDNSQSTAAKSVETKLECDSKITSENINRSQFKGSLSSESEYFDRDQFEGDLSLVLAKLNGDSIDDELSFVLARIDGDQLEGDLSLVLATLDGDRIEGDLSFVYAKLDGNMLNEDTTRVSGKFNGNLLDTTTISDKVNRNVLDTTSVSDKVNEKLVDTTSVSDQLNGNLLGATSVSDKLNGNLQITTSISDKFNGNQLDTTSESDKFNGNLKDATSVTDNFNTNSLDATSVSEKLNGNLQNTTSISNKLNGNQLDTTSESDKFNKNLKDTTSVTDNFNANSLDATSVSDKLNGNLQHTKSESDKFNENSLDTTLESDKYNGNPLDTTSVPSKFNGNPLDTLSESDNLNENSLDPTLASSKLNENIQVDDKPLKSKQTGGNVIRLIQLYQGDSKIVSNKRIGKLSLDNSQFSNNLKTRDSRADCNRIKSKPSLVSAKLDGGRNHDDLSFNDVNGDLTRHGGVSPIDPDNINGDPSQLKSNSLCPGQPKNGQPQGNYNGINSNSVSAKSNKDGFENDSSLHNVNGDGFCHGSDSSLNTDTLNGDHPQLEGSSPCSGQTNNGQPLGDYNRNNSNGASAKSNKVGFENDSSLDKVKGDKSRLDGVTPKESDNLNDYFNSNSPPSGRHDFSSGQSQGDGKNIKNGTSLGSSQLNEDNPEGSSSLVTDKTHGDISRLGGISPLGSDNLNGDFESNSSPSGKHEKGQLRGDCKNSKTGTSVGSTQLNGGNPDDGSQLVTDTINGDFPCAGGVTSSGSDKLNADLSQHERDSSAKSSLKSAKLNGNLSQPGGDFSVASDQLKKDLNAQLGGDGEKSLNINQRTSGRGFLYEDEESMSLVIKNVTAADGGEYHVTASNELGEDTTVMNLVVKQPPKIKKVENQSCMTGSTHTVTIEVEGTPTPEVSFYKDGVEIKSSERITITKVSEFVYTITIKETRLTDTGSYSVVAKNEVSQCSDFWQWHVTSPPRVSKKLGADKVCEQKETVTFNIETESEPAPTVKWFKNKTELTESSTVKISTSGSAHSLVITSAERSDAGEYSCEVRNIHGSASDSCILNVRSAPQFTRRLEDSAASEGEKDVEFTVDVAAYPQPTVKWFLGDVEITEKKSVFTRVDSGTTHKLILKEVSSELSGSYSCKVVNELGSDSCQATFTVNRKPRITKSLVDMTVDEGKTLKLDVEVEGCPEPKVKWFKDGKEVTTDARIKIERDTKRLENYHLTVTLVKEEDGGEYEVRAENEFGSVSSKSTVTIHTREVHTRLSKEEIEIEDESKKKLSFEDDDKSETFTAKQVTKIEIEEKSIWDDDDDGKAKKTSVSDVNKTESEQAKKSVSKSEVVEEKSFWDDDDDKEKSKKQTVEDVDSAKPRQGRKSVSEPEKAEEKSFWDDEDDGKSKKPIIEEVDTPKLKAQKSVTEPEKAESNSFWGDDNDDGKSKKPLIEEVEAPKLKAQKSVTEPEKAESKSFCDDNDDDGKSKKPVIEEVESPKIKAQKSVTEPEEIESKSFWGDGDDDGQSKKPIIEEVNTPKTKSQKSVIEAEEIESKSFWDDDDGKSKKPVIDDVDSPKINAQKSVTEAEEIESKSFWGDDDDGKAKKPVIEDVGTAKIKAQKSVTEAEEIESKSFWGDEDDGKSKKPKTEQVETPRKARKSVTEPEIAEEKSTWDENHNEQNKKPVVEDVVPEKKVGAKGATKPEVIEEVPVDDSLKTKRKSVKQKSLEEPLSADIEDRVFETVTTFKKGEDGSIIMSKVSSTRSHGAIITGPAETRTLHKMRSTAVLIEDDDDDEFNDRKVIPPNTPHTTSLEVEEIASHSYFLSEMGHYTIPDYIRRGTYGIIEEPQTDSDAESARGSKFGANRAVSIMSLSEDEISWHNESLSREISIEDMSKAIFDLDETRKVFSKDSYVRSSSFKEDFFTDEGEEESLILKEKSEKIFENDITERLIHISKEFDENDIKKTDIKIDDVKNRIIEELVLGPKKNVENITKDVTETSVERKRRQGGNKLFIVEEEEADSAVEALLRRSQRQRSILDDILTHEDEKATVTVKESTVKDGSTYESLPLVYTVQASGNPKPTVKWIHNDEEVKPCNRVHISNDGELYKIEIDRVDMKDAGEWQAEISNDLGKDVLKAELSVTSESELRKPKFTTPLEAQRVLQREPVSLQAVCTADPQPHVSWLLNGVELTPDNTVQMSEDSKEIEHGLKECTFNLNIPTGRHADTGEYTIRAKNKYGVGESSARLDILLRPEIEGMKDITAVPYEETTFVVNVRANPIAEVKWSKDGYTIQPSSRIEIIEDKEGETYKLLIKKVGVDDGGVYTVTAKNEVGETAQQATLLVHTGEPIFTKPLQNQTIRDFEDATLKVRCDGVPKPEVKWYLAGKELSNDDRLTITTEVGGQVDSELEIKHFNATDVGKYKVRAVNLCGEASCEAEITLGRSAPGFLHKLERSKEVDEGEPLELKAKMDGSPIPTAKWYKDGAELPASSHVEQTSLPDGTVKLNIDHVTPSDCGAYKLVISNPHGEASALTAVAVTPTPRKPSFSQELEDTKAIIGQPLKLEAKVMAFPLPEVKWFKDGIPLRPSQAVNFVNQPGGVIGLCIENCKPEDAGVYSLTVTNKLGEIGSKAKAEVQQKERKPAFIAELQPAKVIEGFPARMEVKVLGHPPPTIKWTHNGKEIVPDGQHIKVVSQPDGTHALLIDKAAAPDAGTYSVIAVNDKGQTESKADLNVASRQDDSTPQERPQLIHGLRDMSVDEGQPLVLSAPFVGNPIPEVSWTKDGQPLKPSERVLLTCDGKRVGLEINPVEVSDAGKYGVKLVNPLGEDASEGNINVRKVYQAPTFAQKFTDLQQLPKFDAKFPARVFGLPRPDITWYKNNTPLQNTDKYNIKRDGDACCLYVRDLTDDDAGNYKCVARNKEGEAVCEAVLQVVDKIGRYQKVEPPSFLKKIGDIEVFRGMSAKFTACATGSPEPEVEWFHNDVKLFPSSRIRIDTESTGLLRLTISGIDPADVGTYKCRIYNPHGEAECSASLTYDTLEPHTSKRPISDQYSDFDKMKKTGVPMPLADRPIISRMADRHLTLSWKPSIPHGPRFPVTYQVEMCELPEGEWFTARTNLRSCACDIRNLEPFRDYKFRIRVENKYGVSDPSPHATTHRAKLDPDPPKFVPYLEPGIDFRPETSPYFPKDFDIERPPHDGQAQAPRFLRQEHDSQYGVKGHNANLFWFVYGYPKPKMTYFFNDEPIEIGGRYDWSYTRNGQATLFINKMLERDAGWYEAVATNEHGQARQRVRLELAEYPAFIRRPEETVVLQRKTARIEARVTGVPYPDIKWYKDWQPLAPSSRIKMQFKEPDTCILVINDAILKDEGLYSISARNVAGSVSSSAMLYVEESEHEYQYRVHEQPPRVKPRGTPFGDFYDLGDELGRGVQGVVYHAAERLTGRNYAAKIMHGDSSLKPFMKNELDIMNILNDRHLVRLHDAFEHEHTLALLTELAAGGELVKDRLLRSQQYTEREIAGYIRQVLRGLKYMHDNNVAHLGLTIGELLLSHAGSDELKICDFGLSRRIHFNKHASLDYGMPEFVAPEVANGEGVSFGADMWSVGIITYILLSGHSPFRGHNDRETLTRIKDGRWEWHDEVWWSRLSTECRDFISKLLTYNWHERMDVNTALSHPWLTLADRIYQEEYQISTDTLRNYYNLYRDWTSNAQCRNWFRRRPLSGAFEHPSKMVYPPGEVYTPEGTPERDGHDRKGAPYDLQFKQWEHPDWEVSAKSESHYQNGPDTYLLQLRDTQFPVRLREYMKVACGRSPGYSLNVLDTYDPRTPIIRERRRFTDIMDEEIDDERKERINNYGSESYTIRRLRHELGTRLDSYAEAQALMESKKDGQGPFFREKPQILPIREGEPAQLSCFAVGDPAPNVQWFKNDMVIAEGQRIKIEVDEDGRSTLKFEPAMHHDIGFYKVVARNKVGQTVARARIVEATHPDAPDSPSANDISDTEVLLRWKQPKYDGNSPVVCYSLQYKEGDSIEWKDAADNIDHEFFLVRHLQPETSYQFRLSSRNRIGWSDKGIPTNLIKTKALGAARVEITKAMKHLQQITEAGQPVVLDEDRPKLNYATENSPVDWDTSNFQDRYSFISELWRGKFSIVVKGVDKNTDNVVVAKLLENRPETEVQVLREFECLRRLRHERISNLLAAYQVPGSPVSTLVMEKLQGADILTYLSSRHDYTEQMVATIVEQILDGLQYLHWRGYCHLDLQPDNVVMASVRSIQVKLVDFGSAHKVTKLGTSVPQVGELEYKAPEIISDEPAYHQTDMWSVGVLAYIMLSGVSPFRGADVTETRQNIVFVRYRFEHLYKEITQEATRFLMFLFKRVPLKRPTAEECYEHRWLTHSDFMNKKRERAVFLGTRLKEFSTEYHERKASEASQADTTGAWSAAPRQLARSNSIQDELLTTFSADR